jgi:hypothetical protein
MISTLWSTSSESLEEGSEGVPGVIYKSILYNSPRKGCSILEGVTKGGLDIPVAIDYLAGLTELNQTIFEAFGLSLLHKKAAGEYEGEIETKMP